MIPTTVPPSTLVAWAPALAKRESEAAPSDVSLDESDRPAPIELADHVDDVETPPAPVGYLVAERRQGVWMVGDDWSAHCATRNEAEETAARWRSHGPGEVGVFALVPVAVGAA